MKEALDVYLSSDLPERDKIEKSLELTNRALELDDQNISALTHKTTLLVRKKDIEGLLLTVDDLIRLSSEKPYYLGQKAVYLELSGDTLAAVEYYDRALDKYEKHLKEDSLDFNLWIEYVGLLEITGDTTRASEMLTRMTNGNFKDTEKERLNDYRTYVHETQVLSKEELKKIWTGEVSYEHVVRH